MNVWNLYYIHGRKSYEYVEMDDFVLVQSWFGNEKPSEQNIKIAKDQSMYGDGGVFILLTTTEMG